MGGTRRVLVTMVLLGAGLVLTAPATPAQADGNEAPGAPLAARALTAGVNHACAILSDGRVKCWGQNGFGTLGLGDGQDRGDDPGEMGDNLPFVALGTGRTATAISAGSFHNCAILDNSTVKCWGSGSLGNGAPGNIGNEPGEMGDNLPPVDLGTGRTATAISAGDSHTCAILDGGDVKCWGANVNGRLGLGDTTSRGFGPNQMGDNLPVVALGTGRTATAISAGGNHTCAILDNGTVKCWGYAGWGGLGYGNENSLGDQAGEMGDSLPAVNLGATAVAITAGGSQTCAILTGGVVRCWGYNVDGQLGAGITNNYLTSPTGALSLGSGRTATALSGGGSTCVVLDDGTARCWGLGTSGQLGRGSSDSYGNQVGQVPSALAAIDLGQPATMVTAGGGHNCARLADGAVKCWGFNVSGQLGQGDNVSRGSGPGQMGANLPPIDLGSSGPPTCDGQAVTVDLNLAQAPTAGPDVIRGTPGPDTINALGGADRICGGNGIDTVNAGAGADRVFGDAGNDVLRGGTDNDRLDGGDQNDDLFGDAGVDTLFGRNGADDLAGGDGNDAASGGAGNDRLYGQNQNDNLKGEAGNDTLDGGNNNDALAGGPNTDNCNGRAGVDTQTGCEVRAGFP